VRKLDIIDSAPQRRGQERNGATPHHLVSLQAAVDELMQLTNIVTLQAQSISSLSHNATETYSLHEGIKISQPSLTIFKALGSCVHFWHGMNEIGDERQWGYYSWQEVHDARKALREMEVERERHLPERT